MGGIYLLLASSSMIGVSNYALIFAAILGIITALFAASTAIVQNDIKRVIAYSTCSQFGYLFASIGLSQTMSTVLHLSSHAGFKALLFICAGGVIHSMKDEQDLRRLGGLINLLPLTYACMLIASLSLMAMPYLSGNASKDLILELAAVHITIPGTFMWILGSLIAGITACYSIRLLALTFYKSPSSTKYDYQDIHESTIGVIIPMVVLAIISIFFGYVAKEPLAGMGTDSIVYYSNLVHTQNDLVIGNLTEAEFGLTIFNKNVPIISTFIGTALGIIIFIMPNNKISSVKTKVVESFAHKVNINIFSFLSNKWWVDGLLSRIISWPYLKLGLFTSNSLDRGLFELFGVWGLTLRSNHLFNHIILNNYVKNIENPAKLLINQHKQIKNYAVYFTNNVPEYALYIGIFALGIIASLISTNILGLLILNTVILGIVTASGFLFISIVLIS